MKAFQKFLLFAGILFVICAAALIPKIYGAGRFNAALADGGGRMMSGDFARGAAKTRYALEQLRLANGTLDAGSFTAVRNAVITAAAGHPLESLPGLALLHDYGIGLTCAQKESVVLAALKKGVEFFRKQQTAQVGNALYVTALWGQDCPLSDKSGKWFAALMEIYRKASNTKFAADSWQAKALARQTVDEDYQVQVLKPKELEEQEKPSIKQRALALFESVKYTIMHLVPQGGKSAPAGKPAPAAAPSLPAISGETPAATGTTPAPVVNQQSEIPNPKSEIQPAPPEKKSPKLISKMPPSSNTLSGQQMCARLKDLYTLKGLTVDSVEFSPEGNVLSITVRTGSVRDALSRETGTIVTTAYQEAGAGQNGVAADKILIFIKSQSGASRFKWGIRMSDYAAFRNKSISKETFFDRWEVTVY